MEIRLNDNHDVLQQFGQIRFGNLSKEGHECKSEKKINIRHSNKHLQNK